LLVQASLGVAALLGGPVEGKHAKANGRKDGLASRLPGVKCHQYSVQVVNRIAFNHSKQELAFSKRFLSHPDVPIAGFYSFGRRWA
jgi:hypothetical protein